MRNQFIFFSCQHLKITTLPPSVAKMQEIALSRASSPEIFQSEERGVEWRWGWGCFRPFVPTLLMTPDCRRRRSLMRIKWAPFPLSPHPSLPPPSPHAMQAFLPSDFTHWQITSSSGVPIWKSADCRSAQFWPTPCFKDFSSYLNCIYN